MPKSFRVRAVKARMGAFSSTEGRMAAIRNSRTGEGEAMSINHVSNRVFGPLAPSRLALMGIRFIDGEDGAAPAVPDAPKPAEPAQDTTDWKAESRKWENRAKENGSAAQRLAEIEDAKKSDEQKVTDRIAAAEKRAADLEVKATRAEVAAAKGVPVEMLQGSTQEELEASADALIAYKGIQPEAAQTKSYIIPDEGGVPALSKADDITPGMGTLRAAYAQEKA